MHLSVSDVGHSRTATSAKLSNDMKKPAARGRVNLSQVALGALLTQPVEVSRHVVVSADNRPIFRNGLKLYVNNTAIVIESSKFSESCGMQYSHILV